MQHIARDDCKEERYNNPFYILGNVFVCSFVFAVSNSIAYVSQSVTSFFNTIANDLKEMNVKLCLASDTKASSI